MSLTIGFERKKSHAHTVTMNESENVTYTIKTERRKEFGQYKKWWILLTSTNFTIWYLVACFLSTFFATATDLSSNSFCNLQFNPSIGSPFSVFFRITRCKSRISWDIGAIVPTGSVRQVEKTIRKKSLSNLRSLNVQNSKNKLVASKKEHRRLFVTRWCGDVVCLLANLKGYNNYVLCAGLGYFAISRLRSHFFDWHGTIFWENEESAGQNFYKGGTEPRGSGGKD